MAGCRQHQHPARDRRGLAHRRGRDARREWVTQTVGSIAGVAGTGITLGGGSLTTGEATSTSFDGAIGGAGTITKTGSGTWTLSGANSYTGATTISGGTLQIGNGGATGTLGSGAVIDNSTLEFKRSDSYTVANAISGSVPGLCLSTIY